MKNNNLKKEVPNKNDNYSNNKIEEKSRENSRNKEQQKINGFKMEVDQYNKINNYKNNTNSNSRSNNSKNNKNSNNRSNNSKNNKNSNNKSNNSKNNMNSNSRLNNSKNNMNSNSRPNNSKNNMNSNSRLNNSKNNMNSNSRLNNSKNNMNSNSRPNNSKNNMNSNSRPNNSKNNINSNRKLNNCKNNKNSNNKSNNYKNNLNSNNKQNNIKNNVNVKNKQNNFKNNIKLNNQQNNNLNIKEEKQNNQNNQNNQNVVETKVKEISETKKSHIMVYIILIILAVILFLLGMFVYNIFNTKINGNVYIEDFDVSRLEFEEAKEKLENEYEKLVKEDVNFVYQGNEYKINLEEIGLTILTDKAAIDAKKIGRNENIILAIKEYCSSIFGEKRIINLEFGYDEEKLVSKIKEIEKNFYKEVKQYSYRIEDNKLKITNGSSGIKIEYRDMINELIAVVRKRELNNQIEIPIKIEEPKKIDVDKIHDEVFVESANAYYEKEPFKIYNEVIGIDFDTQQLNHFIEIEPQKEEYVIDLKITEPQIKVDDLGLYNDILGQCRTAYVNNPNRTVNLRLAAGKINGKILMPGESFSYNEVVGERTVAAGYRNAAIYINGEVEDGLAGGICQISSTLYDAVVFANLQVDERFNHARVPSYVTAGRDATVYWGSKDFKFTNNREYPVKIEITVNGGYAQATIYGMKTESEYEISFASSVVSRYNGYMVVKTYKVYKQNGVEIKRELISTDSYKV